MTAPPSCNWSSSNKHDACARALCSLSKAACFLQCKHFANDAQVKLALRSADIRAAHVASAQLWLIQSSQNREYKVCLAGRHNVELPDQQQNGILRPNCSFVACNWASQARQLQPTTASRLLSNVACNVWPYQLAGSQTGALLSNPALLARAAFSMLQGLAKRLLAAS